jgi:hypothetical protein
MNKQQLFKTERFKLNRSRTIVAAIVEGDTMYFGVAKCNRKDSFNKVHGKEIALRRAKVRPWYSLPIDNTKPIGRQFNLISKQLLASVSKNFSEVKNAVNVSSWLDLDVFNAELQKEPVEVQANCQVVAH